MAKRLRGVKVAVLAMDGFEQVELTSPKRALEKQGATVEVVSLHRGKIRGINLMYPGRKVWVDRVLGKDNISPDDYDALFIPGGFINPDFLRGDERAKAFAKAFDEAGKPIFSLCHGPWLLVSADRVRGRRLASWPGIRDDVKNAGGTWINQKVVRDRNWVTSRSPLDLPAFNREILSALEPIARASPVHPRKPRPVHRRGLGWLGQGAAAARQMWGGNTDRLPRAGGARRAFGAA